MGIQINGQTDTISALDNNFSLAGNVSIGGTLTYEDVTSVDAVGLSTFQAGIHIDDSIAHLGDTDTKIRFPANDTFTVETAGSERVRVTSAGLVGIGLTNPFGQLQVRAGTNANFSFSTGGGESSFEILNDAGSANVPLNVRASEYKIKIQGNEKVRITSAGLVGIGNTSPESYGSDGRNLVIGNSDSNAATGITLVSGTGGYSQLYFADGTSGSELYSGTIGYNHSENRMDFWTNGVRRLRINSTGNIGINSTDPTSYGNSQATLVIEDTTNPAICISDTGQTKDWWLVGFGDGLGVRYADGGGSGSASNVTSSMFFKNNGNLGVGNNNPQSKLQIENAGEQLRLTYPSVASYIHEVKSDGDYAIDKDGTERLRIKSTGEIEYAGSLLTFANSGGTVIQTVQPGVSYKQLDIRGSTIVFGVGAGSATERLRISSDGYITAPFQPSFSCYKNGHFNFTSNTVTTIAPWTEQHDTHSDFNATTGVFTAPVAGKYFFYLSTMCQRGGNGDFQIRIYKNGSLYVNSNDMNDAATTTFQQTTINAVISLAENDTVTFTTRNSTDTTSFIYQGAYTHCGGYLIG